MRLRSRERPRAIGRSPRWSRRLEACGRKEVGGQAVRLKCGAASTLGRYETCMETCKVPLRKWADTQTVSLIHSVSLSGTHELLYLLTELREAHLAVRVHDDPRLRVDGPRDVWPASLSVRAKCEA